MTDYAFISNQTDMDNKKRKDDGMCSKNINVNDLFSGTKEYKK